MSNIHSYWNSEGDPAVLVNLPEKMKRGYLIPQQGGDWEAVTQADVLGWFKAGSEMAKDDFEATFGKIGRDLPQLPPV